MKRVLENDFLKVTIDDHGAELIFSSAHPVTNSRELVITTEPAKSKSRLSFSGVRANMIITRPKPYTGQTGPFKKPRFTNLPVFTAKKDTSVHQPRKA